MEIGGIYQESDFEGFKELKCPFKDCRYFKKDNDNCLILVKNFNGSLLVIDLMFA